jgi:predicted transcriptional regulator
MVFNVFEGNSAREIAGMFTAAMVERLYAADKQGALLELEEEGKVDESALNEWALRAAAELRNRIDLSNPVYVKRDAKVLYRMLQKEAERFFAGGENGELLILREKEKIVLRYLAKIPDLKQYQSDIESGTDLSRKTIAKILNSLYSKGLVIKHKRGVSITPKGLKHAKESP